MNYAKLTKAALIKKLTALQARRDKKPAQDEQKRLLHELQVHQIELEMQNRELQEAQQKLEASRDRYMELYDFAPVGYVTLDRYGAILEVNLTGAAMLGVERPRLLRKPFASCVAPNDVPTFRHHLRQCKQTQQAVTTELSLADKKGRTLEVQLVSQAVREPGASATVYRTAITNLSERLRAANETRKQSEELFRILYNNTPVMMHSINRAGELINVNDFWLTTTGYEREEVLRKKVFDFFTETSRQYATTTVFPRFLKTGSLKNEAFQLVKKNGDVIEVLLTATSKRNEHGEVEQSYTFLADVTAQKRALAALQESEAKFRTLADTVTAGIFIFQGTKIRYTNPAAESLSGYSRAEILAMDFCDVIHPEFKMLVQERGLARQRGEPVPQRYEIKLLTKAGEERWVDFTASLMTFEGKPAVIGTALDITARKQTEHALQKSEELHRLLYNHTPVMMHSINRAGELINVNEHWLKVMGYTREEVFGQKVTSFLTEASRDYAQNVAFPRFFAAGVIENVEYQWRKKNGEIIDVVLSAVAVPDEHGETKWGLAFILDVTKQKRTLVALQESETKFRALAETVTAGIFIFQGPKMRYANTAAERLSGYSREELFGMNFWDVVHPEFQALVRERGFARQRGESVPQHYEVKILTKQSEERWVDFSAAIMEFEGTPAILGTALDITARKEAEENIRQLNERLEQRVLERTLELEESRNRFQQIVENIHEVMWVESVTERKLIYVSSAFEKIWGYPSARLFEAAEFFLTTIAPEDREAFKAHLRTQRRGERSQIEYRITRADGETRWIRDRSVPIRDEQGNVYRTAGIAEDITAQKREEENRQMRIAQMLKQQAALLQLAQADNTNWEAACRRMTETSAELLCAARVSVWLFNEERTAFLCADLFELESKRHASGEALPLASYPRYFSALQNHRVIAAHHARTDPNTSEFTENYLKPLNITAMLDVPIWQGGQVRGILCHEHTQTPRIWTLEEQEFAASLADLAASALEAAERKRAEEEIRSLNLELEQRVLARTAELRESEARFRQMAENISDVFWLDTGDLSRTLYVSPAFEEIWGRSSQRVLEHPETWREALHPEDRERALAQAECWVNEGMKEPYQANYRIMRPDGAVRWISNQAFPIRNEAGEVYRVAGVAKDVTVRTQAEEQLAYTASQLRAILNALPDMYFRLTADGTYVDYSAPSDMEFFAPPTLFIGKNIDDILPSDLASLFHERELQTLRTQKLTTVEYTLPMSDGEHYYEARLSPLGDKEIVSLTRDVTERKRAELALRESEERYRTLAESARDFVFIVDREGFVRYFNAFAASYFERTPSGLIGKHGSALFAPAHYQGIWQSLQTVFATGKPLRLEGRVKFPRQTLWLDAQLIPLHVEAGEVQTLMGVARDFTERKWAEDELSATSSRLMALMENLQSGILFENETRRILYVNPKFCASFDLTLSPAQLIGMNCSAACEMLKKLFVNAEEFVARVEDIIAARRLVTNEELRLLDGRTFERDAVPVFVHEKFVGQLWRYRDITPRKQLEAQLLEHTTTLEEMVAARTQRIQELERQRVEQEKLAATGRMAARVAHEINNPLGTIKTAFRLVSRAVASEHRHYPMVGTIEKEIDRIAAIVRQMLDLHRPPEQEELRPLRADHSIREILELMKPHAQEYGVTLDLNLTQAQTLIVLPESMLRQVLYNIVLNAIEATPPNGVVQVHAGVADTFLEIQVRDQGPGIPAEIAAQIFEPFFTTKSRSRTGGMGLGLSISKNLIEAVKGELTFDSKPGAGTTCRIVIPLA